MLYLCKNCGLHFIHSLKLKQKDEKDLPKPEYTINKHLLCEFTPMFLHVFINKHEPAADTASQHEN